MLPKLNVLFLCTGNACRSQMNRRVRDKIQPFIETQPKSLSTRANQPASQGATP